MRAPLSWIREFTPVEAAPADVADALNQLGLEVEEIDEPGREINGVIVAKILDVVPHPDADRIRLADIDYGDGQLRVVCGAPNIEPGMVVPYARLGAVLPGDFKIERRKIRGVVSEGMLCSPRELGLGDDHGGILALAPDAPLGADVREVLGLDDVVFHLAITPNRPDAMGITGVAREIAAAFGLPFTLAAEEPASIVDTIGESRVVVEARDRCPRFVAMTATVTMGPSPEWMQQRLRLAGMRPISNVVDVTNYVMLERCRPLHAFDLGRLAGKGIVVRLATAGEQMETLDGVVRTLTNEDLLICDATGVPQGIAGIMGGADAEVSDTTTEILLESAYFEPTGIARSAKRIGLRSEASARFERGIDPNGTASGAQRAMDLFAEVAGAQPAAGTIDEYPAPVARPRISVRSARVNALLGTELDATAMQALLTPLGVETEGTGADFVAVAPTFRPDVEREIDVVEEVARRVGLQNIPRTVPSNPAKTGSLTPEQRERRAIADVLVGAGYDEAYTLPLLAPADLTRTGTEGFGVVEVENPLRAEESILRPALLPGLLRAAAFNAAHGTSDVALFELGTVFAPPALGEPLPRESLSCAMVRTGSVRARAARTGSARDHRRRGGGGRGARGRTAARRLAIGSRRRRARLPPDARGGCDRRRAARGRRRRSRRACAPRVGSRRSGGRVRTRRGRARRRSAAATPRVARLAVPGVVHRSRVRRRRHRAGRRPCARHCARRPARWGSRSSSSTSSAPRASGRAGSALRSRARSGLRIARSPTPKWPPCGKPRSTPSSRPTAPNCAHERAGPERPGAEGAERRRGKRESVHAPDPGSVRGNRWPRRRVQRALADLLRRDVHPLHGFARLR